jgi:hypothetical protein
VAEGVVAIAVPVRPPIFIFDTGGNDVAVFKTVAEAETFMEPPDVPETEAFDAEGTPLDASVVDRRVRLGVSTNLAAKSRLRDRIMSFLEAIDAAEDLQGLDWTAFIAEAEVRIAAWQRHRRR